MRYLRGILTGLFVAALLIGVVSSAPSAAADVPMVYVVGWGDTLITVAARYGTTLNALMAANGIRNPDFIYIGQRLTIPGNTAPAPAPTTTYLVQSGDTLFSIAMRNGTSVEALMQANRLYNYWIYVGQSLKIQAAPAPRPVPVPPPAPRPVPIPQGVYHIVRPGEYLELIAARFGSSVYAIQFANKLANASFIWAGQSLFIPGGRTPINPPSPVPAPAPIVVPPIVVPPASGVIVVPPASTTNGTGWQATLVSNTTGTGPCSIAATVTGMTNWPVVVATPDGSWISDPKLTGTKPERGPYVVEFAHACVGVWRVIPLGLNIYADVQLNGGHAELEFDPLP